MADMLTISDLTAQFRALGMAEGHTVIVHAALSKVRDWICGDVRALMDAFDAVLGPEGTLAMPTHTSSNSDPAEWENPPVPDTWWPRIRAEMPAYDPATSPTRRMGVLAETFRRWPQTQRSAHPQLSMAARGKHAEMLTAVHRLDDATGETSPYARLLDLDAHVLLIGVGHGNNTTLHVAEHRAQWPSKTRKMFGAAVMENGVRKWATFEDFDEASDDFAQLGADYEAAAGYVPGRIGQAEARYLRLRPLIEFAVPWMNAHRH